MSLRTWSVLLKADLLLGIFLRALRTSCGISARGVLSKVSPVTLLKAQPVVLSADGWLKAVSVANWL